ncbi:MAG: hypothetical protein ACRD88_16385, partial [Terriglobia bacterium]
MQCPTCGRRVGKGQETCSFCGAYVQNADLASPSNAAPPPVMMEERKPVGSPAQGPVQEKQTFPADPFERDLEELEEEEAGPMPGPAEAPPASPPPQQPKYARLLRILFPLLFILIPLYNLLVRNIPLDSEQDERPVLQETQFFENIAGGRLVNPQTVFSRSQHQRVVVFARWNGSRGRHSYTFRWHTPQGSALPNASTVTRFQFGSSDDVFSAYAILPLNAGLPTGTWRVEIVVD